MKTLFLILISFSAFAQIDTTPGGKYFWVPDSLPIREEPRYDLFKLKFRKLSDTTVSVDGNVAYVMEINIDGMNKPGSKARILSIAVATNADFTAADKKQIQDLVNELAGTDTTVPTDTATVTIKVDAEAMTFSSDWNRHGSTADTTWYQKTIAYSYVPTSSAKYSFNGKRVEVWGERKSTQGTGVIIVDDVSHNVSWKTEPYGLPVLIFAKDLSVGNHEIEVKPVEGNVLIDFLRIKQPK
jgi:hypothetical protein